MEPLRSGLIACVLKVFTTAHEERELQPGEICTLLTPGYETTTDELELIETRYQQALAIKNLEALFTDDPLDRR